MSPIPDDLGRLDQLIRDLDDRMDTPQGLIREHLTAARSFLLEAAGEEFKLMLQMVEASLPLLEDPALRSRIEAFLAEYRPS